MANYNVGNIEIGISAKSTDLFSEIDKTITKLKDFERIDSNLQNVFNSINKLANAFKKFEKMDFRNIYSSFNTLTRIIDPFLQKIQQAEPSLQAFSNSLDLGKVYTQMSLIEAKVNAINEKTKSKKLIDEVNLERANVQLEYSKKKLKDLNETSKKFGKSYKFAFSLFKFDKLIYYGQKLANTIVKVVKYASDYQEILNKYYVSFKDLYSENIKLTNQLAQAFGFSTNTLMDYTATFNNMLKGLKGLDVGMSATLSQTLTKMAIDYSSLFNVSIERSMNAFQSAISGNIRTLRNVSGFDVSETTIFSIYQQMGGTKTMRQLNQLEKRLLRIVAIQQQLEETGALGDYAKTIETTSNQIKIMKENIIELGKWVGKLVLVVVKPLIKYINAGIMVVKELARNLAETFASKQEIDLDGEFASFGETLGDVNEEVGELSQSLSQLGLDQLNILGSNSSNSLLSGLSVEGVILNSLQEYSMNLDEIKYKAKKISEDVLDWLGFTKILNEETGEYTYHLKEGESLTKSILSFASNLAKYIKDIVKEAGTLLSKVGNFLDYHEETINEMFELIISVGTIVADTILGSIQILLKILQGDFKGAWETVKSIVGDISEEIESIFGNIDKIINALKNFGLPDDKSIYENKGPAIGNLPGMATGGVVRKATPVVVGEYSGAKSNPEIISPQNIMAETFNASVTPLVNTVLQSNKNVVDAINSKDFDVYMNGRKVSESLYSDLETTAYRKGKIMFANR